MTTKEPTEPSVAQAKAGWSLDLPDKEAVDGAVDEERELETHHLGRAAERGEGAGTERGPDPRKPGGGEGRSDTMEGGR